MLLGRVYQGDTGHTGSTGPAGIKGAIGDTGKFLPIGYTHAPGNFQCRFVLH